MRLHSFASALSAMLAALPAHAAHHSSEGVQIIAPASRSVAWTQRTDPVELRSVYAGIEIRDRVAATRLTLTLENPSSRRAEAQVLLPVPAEAVITGLLLGPVSAEMEGVLMPADDARRIYRDIVMSMRDPALLEFADQRTLRTSVFPVEPRSTQTVEIRYETLLSEIHGRLDYALPRTQTLQAAAVWTIECSIVSSRPIAGVYSPTHGLVIERHDHGRWSAKSAANATLAPGPLRLVVVPQSESIPVTTFLYPEEGRSDADSGYFLALVTPPYIERDGPALRREVTIVIDRSGSMNGPKMAQAKAAALQVIEGLEPGEWFNIIDFSREVTAFSDGPVKKTAETVGSARTYIDRMRPGGTTFISGALERALAQPASEADLRIVLFLTDGLANVGLTSESAILEMAAERNTKNRRIFSFGVGFDVNAPLLDGLAYAAGGISTYVQPQEDVEEAVSMVFDGLAGPIMTDVRFIQPSKGSVALDGDEPRDLLRVSALHPSAVPDIYSGRQLVLLGRYSGGEPGEIQLVGRDAEGENRSIIVTIDPSAASVSHAFVPRLWANRQIAAMIDDVRRLGADGRGPDHAAQLQSMVDEIVQLSLEFGVMTEYTAFLAREDVRQPVVVGQRGDGRGGPSRSPNPPAPGDSGASGAPPSGSMPLASVNRQAADVLRERAVASRSGAGGVSQAMNLNRQRASDRVDEIGNWVSSDMRQVRSTAMRQVADVTLVQQGDAWVDGRVLARDRADEKPVVIEVGTPEWDALMDRFLAAGRAAVLAQRGELLLLDGDRLVRIVESAV